MGWDRYFEKSLKSGTRENRGKGVHKKVTPNGSLPSNWSTLLRCSDNKRELFPFLSQHLIELFEQSKFLVATDNEMVISNQLVDLSSLMPCNIEESDGRMFLHAHHASNSCQSIMIQTPDSDVVSIGVALYQKLRKLRELWIEYGRGKDLKFIPIHEIANTLGPSTSKAILFFTSISGCDECSSVQGKGKKSFFDAWKLMPEMTAIFIKLSEVEDVADIVEEDFQALEKFFVVLHSATLNTDDINVARRVLFTQGGRTLENLPPTSCALKQHVLRSSLQAQKWARSLVKDAVEIDPENWGWKKVEGSNAIYQPYWTELEEISAACKVLTKCGCKKACRGRCKCRQQGLECTELCACSGQC